MMSPDDDKRLMAAAISLSRQSLGLAAPNPSVGALVVKDGVIVGRGVTAPGGRPHAETQALREAGAAAKGATLYVSLEPCSHQGKTPPCTDAIIDAGIKRVVSALEDPNPRVAGEGHRRLLAAGIELVTLVLADKARRLHLGHILSATAQRPMITLKLAETADGYAAGKAGEDRLMITGKAASDYVHMQRALHDAILIGSGTAIADDPLLTVRLAGLDARKPLRVVLDTQLRLSPQSKFVETASDVPTLAIAGQGAAQDKMSALAARRVEVVTLPCDAAGRVDLDAALAHLAMRGITRVFSEGGPCLGAALIAAGYADEVLMLKSSNALGHKGIDALNAQSRKILSDEAFYCLAETRALNGDTLTRYERKF